MKVKEITVMVPTAAPDVREGDKKWSKVFDSVAKKMVSDKSQRYVCWQIEDEEISIGQKDRMQNYVSGLLNYDTLVGWAWDHGVKHVHECELPEVKMYEFYRSLWCKRLAKQFRKAGL